MPEEQIKCKVCGESINEKFIGNIPQCTWCGGYFHSECWFGRNEKDAEKQEDFEDFCSQECYKEWKEKKDKRFFY